MQFWKPSGNVSVKMSEIFCLMIENGQNVISPSFLFQKIFCTLRKFWRTNRRQFWQPRWNFSDERPKNYLYVQKCINKNVNLLKVHFLPQMFLYTHIDCIFDNLNQKLWRKAKNFCSMSKIVFKSQFFNKIFSSIWFYGHIESIFDTSSPKRFRWKNENFSFIFQKNIK